MLIRSYLFRNSSEDARSLDDKIRIAPMQAKAASNLGAGGAIWHSMNTTGTNTGFSISPKKTTSPTIRTRKITTLMSSTMMIKSSITHHPQYAKARRTARPFQKVSLAGKTLRTQCSQHRRGCLSEATGRHETPAKPKPTGGATWLFC